MIVKQTDGDLYTTPTRILLAIGRDIKYHKSFQNELHSIPYREQLATENGYKT